MAVPAWTADIDPDADEVLPLWEARADLTAYRLQADRGDGVIRISEVENPTLAWYPAHPSDGPTPAVLVCPGGGYSKLAYNKEGTEIATWLNGLGISAGVLKYRVPDNRDGALEDAQRAMGLLRHRASAWNIDPTRVGVLGFSAGGHLAARLSTQGTARAYPKRDGADDHPCRPDFTVLVYPAYLGDDTLQLPAEIPVASDTPPAFIVQTQDDRHYIDSSLAYYVALKKANVPAELHLFPEGGHGYGMRPSTHAVSGWPALCARWMTTIGIR
jgi:acetyl esterase/lipase